MTIKVGTIQEMTGEGYEILVDAETRTLVLAKFFNGNFIGTSEEIQPSRRNTEPTVASLDC